MSEYEDEFFSETQVANYLKKYQEKHKRVRELRDQLAERDKIIDECLEVIKFFGCETRYNSEKARYFLNSDLIKKYKEKRGV